MLDPRTKPEVLRRAQRVVDSARDTANTARFLVRSALARSALPAVAPGEQAS